MFSSATVSILRYIGTLADWVDTTVLVNVKPFNGKTGEACRNPELVIQQCPFSCGKPMGFDSDHGGDSQRRNKLRFRCSDMHRVFLLKNGTGDVSGWE